MSSIAIYEDVNGEKKKNVRMSELRIYNHEFCYLNHTYEKLTASVQYIGSGHQYNTRAGGIQ